MLVRVTLPVKVARDRADLGLDGRGHLGVGDLLQVLAAGDARLEDVRIVERRPDLLARRRDPVLASHFHSCTVPCAKVVAVAAAVLIAGRGDSTADRAAGAPARGAPRAAPRPVARPWWHGRARAGKRRPAIGFRGTARLEPRRRDRKHESPTRRRAGRPTRSPGGAPVMLETEGWGDYALLDSGDGEKLERYGRLPDRAAGGAGAVDAAPAGGRMGAGRRAASSASATTRRRRRAGATAKPLGETWPMAYDGIPFLGRFTNFRHVGVFPEQATHWDWMKRTDRARRAAGEDAQPVRLYRRRLAGRGQGRRRGDPHRRLEEGDRLGAREPGARAASRT